MFEMSQLRLRVKAIIPGAPLLPVLQAVAGVACMLGSYLLVSTYLSDQFAGRPAQVTAARLDGWPEIKNGVPLLDPVTAARARAPTPDPVDKSPGVEASMGAAPVDAGARERVLSEEPRQGGFEPGPTPLPGVANVGQLVAAPSALRSSLASTNAGFQAADGPKAEPSTTGSSKRNPAESRTGRAHEGAPAPRRHGKDHRTVTADQALRAEHRGAGTNKVAATRSDRKRVATNAPQPTTPGTSASAPAQQEAEPVRVLGIALPSGRKIKECLLEMRCS